jgi:hypothetical protein
MGVAWIASRSTAAVLHTWDAYRVQSYSWQSDPTPVLGQPGRWKLIRGQPATLAGLETEATGWGNSYDCWTSIKDSIDVLWKALRDGALQAVGREREVGTEVHIGAEEWAEFSSSEEAGEQLVTAPNGHGYSAVKVYSFDVTRLWPPPKERAIFPETMRPAGPGFMPLYCAAQWIATEGDKQSFVPTDVEVWAKAYSDLLAHIASGKVKVIGKGRNGMNEPIPGYHFASCRVDYPFNDAEFDLILSNELYLRSTPYFGDAHWREGYDDALTSMKGDRWQRVQVLKSDIARHWPFDSLPKAPSDQGPVASGAPGRPSSMHLVEAEFEAREARGELKGSIAEESRALADWLRVQHPRNPKLEPKSIRNKLASRIRAAIAKNKILGEFRASF